MTTQTSLKLADDKFRDEMMGNAPITTMAAGDLLRKNVPRDTTPDTKTVMEYNNSVVDDWEKNVLRKFANSEGKVPAGRVWQSFSIFVEGNDVRSRLKHAKHLPTYSDETVKYWIEYLMQPMSELIKDGHTIPLMGWGIIRSAMASYFANLKYCKVLQNTTDPYKVEVEFNRHPELIHGRPYPYGLNDEMISEMSEKIGVLTRNKFSIV